MTEITLTSLQGFPLVEPDDDLVVLLVNALEKNDLLLSDGDLLVLAQKIVSKSENRYVDLKVISPTQQAMELAKKTDKDPRQMQVLLNESKEVLRYKKGVVIVEHNKGYVHANAGMDKSNIDQSSIKEGKEGRKKTEDILLLLPEDSDKSAKAIMLGLKEKLGADVSVIINDSFGRAWRNGTCGVCIGSAGFNPIDDKMGEKDLFGNELKVTQAAIAEEIAAAASLLMGQAAEGTPVVLIKGLSLKKTNDDSTALIRAKEDDLFR